MAVISRREFVKLLGLGLTGTAALGVAHQPLAASGEKGPRIVVVGGGYGGATCAKYLRRFAPGAHVTLIERDRQYVTCPFSNTVIVGMRPIGAIAQSYRSLRDEHGIDVIHDTVLEIDGDGQKVKLEGGKTVAFDRLVLSPGVDFDWAAIDGYDESVSEALPHAWKAGRQTLILRQQLAAMADGATVIISAPPSPYRCPPGPYERAGLIASYLRLYKPRSKILILDAKDGFAKRRLFFQGWDLLYPGMIEWVGASRGGAVVAVDPRRRLVYTGAGPHRADVINIIPPQKAAAIAQTSGLTDETGWCPIDPLTFRSEKNKNIHVLGDASIAGAMPKSAYSANSQAKLCAAALAAEFRGDTVSETPLLNTCYSLVGPEYGISVAHVFRVADGEIVAAADAGGISAQGATLRDRRLEALYAAGWYESINADTFG